MKNYIVAGIEPVAASIFAVEGMTQKQKESFGKQHPSYLVVCYEPKKMDITQNIDEATLFTEDEAYQFRDTLHINSRKFDSYDVYDINDLKSGAVTVSPEPAVER